MVARWVCSCSFDLEEVETIRLEKGSSLSRFYQLNWHDFELSGER